MLEQLTQLVPADQAGYFEYRVCEVDTHVPATTRNVYLVEDRGATLDWQSEEVESAIASWPLHDSHHVLTTTALRFSDAIPTRLQRLRNAYYAVVMRKCGVEHEMKLWLPSPPGVVRGFFFVRHAGRRDFDERHRQVLTVLRPHLEAVRARWERRQRPPGLSDPRNRDRPPAARRADEPGDRRPARDLDRNGPNTPGEHLRQARRAQPHRRRHARIRPG